MTRDLLFYNKIESEFMLLLTFFRRNWIGASIGAGYCAGAFLAFFFGLSYGAACPESGPQVCNVAVEQILPILRWVSAASVLVWSVIFYSGQQLVLLSGITTSTDYPSSFFAANILPGISIALTLFVWLIIGGFAQKILRRLR